MLVKRWTVPSRRTVIWASILLLLFLWLYQPTSSSHATVIPSKLVQQHIKEKAQRGGRYYIPQSWFDNLDGPVRTSNDTNNIIDAAELALELALRKKRFLTHTKIPLIVHQTWRSMDPTIWPPIVHESIGKWLSYATNEAGMENAPEVAYFLWDDEGLDALFDKYQQDMWEQFQMLPYKVEKADAFRVAVLRWFGGVYADVDVRPLKHPNHWVQPDDLKVWTDAKTGLQRGLDDKAAQPSYAYPPTTPVSWKGMVSGLKMDLASLKGVGAMLGIECDTRPEKDDYWRMGYSYAVQVTNWAMALAPHHPIGTQFLAHLAEQVVANARHLDEIDPLDLTGPPALTGVAKNYTAQNDPKLRWEGLSGLDDPVGGRGKVVVGDVLVLPITAFSPGRGWFHNMGSQPTTHPNARLQHMAAGSWRKTDLKVHAGKLCRTLFGYCKDWKKIPDPPKKSGSNG